MKLNICVKLNEQSQVYLNYAIASKYLFFCKKMNKLIDITNLTVGYDSKPNVLQDVNLSIYQDDFLGIIGPNGGGKTTLLRTILGLIKPQSGSITFYDKGEKTGPLNIGYLPQINQIDKKFPISVSEVILSGLTPGTNIFKRYSHADKQKVKEVAQRLGIEELLQRAIGELSGGQLQRVLLGRAIIDNPKLIILDEPSTYVDKLFETNFYKLFSSRHIKPLFWQSFLFNVPEKTINNLVSRLQKQNLIQFI